MAHILFIHWLMDTFGLLCLYFFNFGQLPLLPTKWKRETLWSQVSVGLKFFPFPMKTRQVAS